MVNAISIYDLVRPYSTILRKAVAKISQLP